LELCVFLPELSLGQVGTYDLAAICG